MALAETKPSGTALVVYGDTPLLSAETLKQIVAAHIDGRFSATVLTAEFPDPTGYGRIVRADNGDLLRIVEERDTDEFQKSIDEINSGVYVFQLGITS